MKNLTLIVMFFMMYSIASAQEPPPPVLGPGEHYTHLWSVSYDYQTNGSVRYLTQDPANRGGYCSILMAQHDSNGAVGVQRYVYYSYSDDNGATWTSDVLETSASWGFPDMSVRNGIPIISAHRFGTLTSVFQDALWGAFSFSQLPATPTNITPSWSHLSATSNGNVVVAASTNDGAALGGFYSTFNGSAWSPWSSLPLLGGPSGNYSVEAGANGVVGIFGTSYLGDGSLNWYKSTDNGVTFNSGAQIFNYVIDGGDTLFPSITGGFQAVFKGEEPHLVFTVYNISSAVFPNVNTAAYVKPKILHWSPSTGVTEVAGHFNIPRLADTITTALIAPVGQPSVSVGPDGKLTCSFTVLLNGNTQVVDDGEILNAGEIFVTTSLNNGVTWTSPVNITNTPGIEEKHSSLINKPAAEGDSAKIYYVRDLKAGGWVNVPAFGKAPVYGIFKSLPGQVGIKQINSQAVSYDLLQNYPNPFNPSTDIKFSIAKPNFTSLIIYDEVGREITLLVNEKLNAGNYEYSFSSENYGLSSGLYFYTLTSGDFKDTKRMLLIK